MKISAILRLAPVSRLLGLLVVLVLLGCWQRITPAQAWEPHHTYLPMIGSARTSGASIAEQVVGLTNSYRAAHGCGPLALDAQLSAAANEHSQDMATHNYFSHTSQDGSSPWDRISRAGYRYSSAAENIGAGYPSAQAVVNSWYNEQPPNDGHRRNMLDCSLTDVGIGYAVNGASTYHIYWTQDFASR